MSKKNAPKPDFLDKVTPPKKRRAYNWRPTAHAARDEPGEWIRNTDPERSKPTAFDIRRGMPHAFQPPGAFDAVVHRDAVYVRYLGEPVKPWEPWAGDDRAFDEIERDTSA